MIDGPALPEERATAVSNMLDGGSVQGAICVGGLCAGVNQSIGPKGSNPPKAIELGVGTPGFSAGVGAATPLPNTRTAK